MLWWPQGEKQLMRIGIQIQVSRGCERCVKLSGSQCRLCGEQQADRRDSLPRVLGAAATRHVQVPDRGTLRMARPCWAFLDGLQKHEDFRKHRVRHGEGV